MSTANPVLSDREKQVYGFLFQKAAGDVGLVMADIAVDFFSKTGLDSEVLGQIWQIADKENTGYLSPPGFAVALRLISHAQAGRRVSADLAFNSECSLPRFDGLSPPIPAQPTGVAPQPTGVQIQPQPSGGRFSTPALSPDTVDKYTSFFNNAMKQLVDTKAQQGQSLPHADRMPKGYAMDIFEKSGLSKQVMLHVWNLVDTEKRDSLVSIEFVIALHLLNSLRNGGLTQLPNSVPPALYEAASRGSSAPRQSPTTTGMPSAIPRQMSGQAGLRTGSPLGRPPMPSQVPGMVPQMSGSRWLVAEESDKPQWDAEFLRLDRQYGSKGYIDGLEARDFFFGVTGNKVSEDDLFNIWDLADMNKDGKLVKETWAVARYLMEKAKAGIPVPQTLDTLVVPPFMRKQEPRPQASSPVQSQPPQVAPPPPAQTFPSALHDLSFLDSAPPTTQPVTTHVTGGSAAKDPFAGGPPTSPARGSPAQTSFKPFQPTSSFGRTLAVHNTGGSGSGRPSTANAAADDLLGDTDPEVSHKLTNESTELANLSNQIGSLSKETQQVQAKRATTQNELGQASEQKKNFEQRLSELRASYEKEAEGVRAMEDQLRGVRAEVSKLTGEMASIQGNYQDIREQHQKLSAALEADRQENASLKQRISATNTEIAQLKPQVEKLKSDARQQKGMVAINKKQLSTVEGERDKLKTEAEELTKSNEELSRQSSPAPVPAQVSSPTPSISANNPFFRRTTSTDIMGTFSSPGAKPYGDKSFDDIFGNFGSASASGTPPPVTSFKQDNTGTSSASAGSFNTPTGSTPTISRQPTVNTDAPPPPPESRQLNSSNLPFGDAAGSLSSSRQVSPPVSRAGDIGSTPNAFATAGPVPADQSATSTPDASNTVAPESTLAAADPIPGAFPSDTPGATPVTSSQGEGKETKRDSDPFGGLDNPPDAKADFDSAFASFTSSASKPQDQTAKDVPSTTFPSRFDTEFPPISEIERDDESDSDDDGNRFDDNFGPASSGAAKPESGEAAASPAPAPAEPVAEQSAPKPTESSGDLSAFPEPPKTSPSFSPPATAQTQDTTSSTTPTATEDVFNDSDDDFEGLEDAKEGSADDEFANISRSNLSDFNTAFDSSPPPSQPKSETTNASNNFGIDSSYDFANVSQTSAATAGGSGTTPSTFIDTSNTTAAPKADGHDWDAMFSSLDSPSAAAATATSGEAKDEKDEKDQNLNPPADRPDTLGRALTEEGKHDDPIVKNLTGMGYSRTDAISALEKYDYNLERAANFLASQS